MRRILCSTGALITAKNNRDYRLLREMTPKIKCDGYEFLMYDSWYPEWEKVAREVAGMNLQIPVLHADKGIGEAISRGEEGDNERALELFEINCRLAQRLGAEKLVLHLWGGLSSDSHIEDNIRQYVLLKEIAVRYGLLLTVENVVCNREDPLTHLRSLADVDPGAAFTLDVRFAKFHDQLDSVFSGEYGWLWKGAVQHIHISDYCGGFMEWEKLNAALHPGEGKIDFEKLGADLKRVGYDNTITLESTSVLSDGRVDLEKLNESLKGLKILFSCETVRNRADSLL